MLYRPRFAHHDTVEEKCKRELLALMLKTVVSGRGCWLCFAPGCYMSLGDAEMSEGSSNHACETVAVKHSCVCLDRKEEPDQRGTMLHIRFGNEQAAAVM